MYGNPVFQFSIVNSGDWIDKQAAKATGESIAFINKEKEKIDLLKAPVNLVERAINTQYRLMIEKTVTGIKNGFVNAKNSVKTKEPINVVVAGGTACATGFDTIFKECLLEAKVGIDIGAVTRPKDALYSVAKGCLLASENAG
jgi:hypothetical protein